MIPKSYPMTGTDSILRDGVDELRNRFQQRPLPPDIDGKFIAKFYVGLTDNGVPGDVALELTRQYLARWMD